tara:strand:+ start:106 stop:318 length:213 start_codon:yes stop_codon:yes gene_type:complete
MVMPVVKVVQIMDLHQTPTSYQEVVAVVLVVLVKMQDQGLHLDMQGREVLVNHSHSLHIHSYSQVQMLLL